MGGSTAATPPAEVRVRLFGELRVDGVAPAALGTRKARTLLGALAVAAGRPVPSDGLAAAVWPDVLPSRPSDQLGVLVSRLRAVVGPHRIRRADPGYTFDPDWTDLAEFAQQADEADAALAAAAPARALARARAALDLATGELLAGQSGEWVDTERRSVERRRARVRLVLAEAAVLAGEPWRAVAPAQEVLDADPYDEAAARVLMRAHVAAGRPAEALAVFAELRARLAADLGADPASETTDLHTRVLRGELTGPVRPPPGPAPAGRARELARLAGLLADAAAGATRVVAVRGEPGIGKTALLDAFVAAAPACTVHGRCDALGRDLPLQPLLDGLEQLLAAVGPDRVAQVLGPDAAIVEPLLGQVDVPATPPVPVDAAQWQARLFAGLVRVLRRAAGEAPLLIAIDDLHLAGPSTLEWLRFAARRTDRTLIAVTTRPPPPPLPDGAEHLDLGPLDLAAATELVGGTRARELWERSGGNPLLLLALAAAGGTGAGGLPATVHDAVEPVLAALGPAGPAVRAAAVLGPEVDVELLAAVLERPVPAVLDDLDAGLRLRLLTDRGGAVVFTHELVREAAAAKAGAARCAVLHRTAAAVLAARDRSDPLTVAWHARRGGDPVLASAQLVRAARLAVRRSDLPAAARLLEDAAELDASADVHLARADILLRRGELAPAQSAARAAIEAGAGAAGCEMAGWTAYYRRDHAQALRFAVLGAERARDAGTRAACAALAGRVHHSRGDLKAADAELTRAATMSTGGMQRVWLAALRVHQGRPDDALELTEQAMTDAAELRHPFAPGHAHFARAYALGMLGRPVEALSALDAGERSPQMQRIVLPLLTMRGWVLRGLGQLAAADEQHERVRAQVTFPGLSEPHAQAALDLVENAVVRGDVEQAQILLARARLQPEGQGTMVWHQRERHGLLTAHVALLDGRFAGAEEAAAAVIRSAARGSRRHELVARILLACARAAAGGPTDPAAVDRDLRALARVAGLEVWRYSALAGRHLRVPRWHTRAERQVAALAAHAGEHADGLRRFAAERLAAGVP